MKSWRIASKEDLLRGARFPGFPRFIPRDGRASRRSGEFRRSLPADVAGDIPFLRRLPRSGGPCRGDSWLRCIRHLRLAPVPSKGYGKNGSGNGTPPVLRRCPGSGGSLIHERIAAGHNRGKRKEARPLPELRIPDVGSPDGPEIYTPREPEIASPREPEIASPRDPEPKSEPERREPERR